MKIVDFLCEKLLHNTEYNFRLRKDSTMHNDSIRLSDIEQILDGEKVVFDSSWWNQNGFQRAKLVSYDYHKRVSYGYYARNAHKQEYWTGTEVSPATMKLRLRTLDGETTIQRDIIDEIRESALDGGKFTEKRLGIIEDVIYEHDWTIDHDGEPILDEVINEIRRRCKI